MSPSTRRTRKSVHSHEDHLLRELLVKARKAAKLTQQTLADRLDRPQSFIAKYEKGERRLDVIEFIEVARKIGADPLRLMRALLAMIG